MRYLLRMRVLLLGRGRLGRTLAVLLARAGVDVALQGRGEPLPPADVVLLTVPDRALAEVARRVAPGPVVLHASGAAPVDVLRPHRPAGSLHPLMTFPGPERDLPDLEGVPAAIAGDPEAVEVARWLAERLGLRPVPVPGDRRLYHAAAVMAGNFPTVLLAEAAALLTAAGLPPEEAPELLAPLALAAMRNAVLDPAGALTGPVARGDLHVIAAHRAALAESGLDSTLRLYDALVESASRLGLAGRERTAADERDEEPL